MKSIVGQQGQQFSCGVMRAHKIWRAANTIRSEEGSLMTICGVLLPYLSIHCFY